MPVWRGDDRLSRTENIRERARGDLLLVQIRRHIDVRRPDEFLQVIERHEAVVENDVLLHTTIFGQPIEAQPVPLAFARDEMRMRGAEYEINDVRVPPHNFRKRLDDVLDALARPEQSEGEQHLLSLDAKLRLVNARIGERDVRDAVRNQINLRRRHRVDFAQHLRAFVRHYHHAIAESHDFVHHLALRGARVAQHRVQCRHHRHPHFLQQREQMTPRHSAEDAELMLHAQHLRIVEVQKIRRAPVRIQVLLKHFKADALRIAMAFHTIVHRSREAFRVRRSTGDRLAQIRRESRDPAAPRLVSTEERDPFRRFGRHEGNLSIRAPLQFQKWTQPSRLMG